jgi:hypothetical protein
LEKINLEDLILEAIYARIGVDLKTIEKEGNWFENYYLPQEEQDEIMESILKTSKLTKRKKQCIRCSVWLGCSPKGVLI